MKAPATIVTAIAVAALPAETASKPWTDAI